MKKEDERIAKIFDDIFRFKKRKSTASVSVSGNDEESENLPAQLVRMISELQSYVIANEKNGKQLKRKNAELIQKVINLNNQLDAVNHELETLSYSVSHDLRAPLRAVDGFTKILEEDYVKSLDDEAKRILTVIQYNANKMSRLIENLLIFSRIGKKEINNSSIDMNFLVDCAIMEVNKAIKHNAKLKVGGMVSVVADYGMIQQVFINLISNAIKFSSNEKLPSVEISSAAKKNEVIFTIKDNGVGFNMKYADKLFGVFQRLHSEEEFEGTGMGLAIVRRIINKHAGRVWAESEIGKGAEFHFALPVISIEK